MMLNVSSHQPQGAGIVITLYTQCTLLSISASRLRFYSSSAIINNDLVELKPVRPVEYPINSPSDLLRRLIYFNMLGAYGYTAILSS